MAHEGVSSVVCWKWAAPKGYRSTFGPETVNVLRQMVLRHYHHPHRFLCVTDDAEGIDAGVEIIPAWNDFADVPNPHGSPRNPSCYRRLRMFHPDIGAVFGERFVSLDLDAVIVGNVEPLWHRPEPIVLWGDTNSLPGSHYNGSMLLMTAGCRPQVWTDFDPKRSPQRSKAARCFGSDQGWISYRLGKGEARWTAADGVYSYRNQIAPRANELPANAKVIFFHGYGDPWDAKHQRIPWVHDAWKVATIAQERVP